ncbi:dUTP diphosphatase [Methylocapsa acidiphila]|uniref:dUTP diphosphatase n=1 Tax=Methylocapsa acidiphila TaxID=133552 RepID=UPI0004017653|nr:dUTP diphosphatase [Methylocapsa acidiphila]
MNAALAIAVRRLPHGEGLPLPDYQTAGAAGLDLLAAIAPGVALTLAPGRRLLAPTGLTLEIPPNYEAQIRPRSGLARQSGVTVLNAPGTIDSDYRGEIGVLLINLGDEPFEIIRGARIAQLVFAPVTRATLFERPDLTATARGEGGFGSTGRMAQEEDGR